MSQTSSTPNEDVAQLYNQLLSRWPEELGTDTQYLCVASILVACAKPHLIKDLYLHLAKTTHTTEEAQDRLSTRLKNLLMKLWVVTGIPPAILAVSALASAEQELHPDRPVPPVEEQRAQSLYFSHETDATTEKRGYDFCHMIYRHNLQPIMSTWGAHEADFYWLQMRVIYGLFLSDTRVLSPVETEIVVMSSMMCQEMTLPAIWHIRGMRRVGVSKEGTQAVLDVTKTVVEWCGRSTEKWLHTDEVEDQV